MERACWVAFGRYAPCSAPVSGWATKIPEAAGLAGASETWAGEGAAIEAHDGERQARVGDGVRDEWGEVVGQRLVRVVQVSTHVREQGQQQTTMVKTR